jgi:hypothetical protein
LLIAHSFGTYAVARILRDQPQIRPVRVIFCGSIVPQNLRWDLIPNRPQIINDCGTRDLWPLLAASTTWGYGPSGTVGFGTPGIQDRYHDFAHGSYFDRDFVETYWKPWIHDGYVETPPYELRRSPMPYWQSLISILPIRIVIAGLFIGIIYKMISTFLGLRG